MKKISKKAWLDYLYYDLGKQYYDFELCGLKIVDGKVIATKWHKYSEVIFPIDHDEDWKIEWINQRAILPFELVLDLEDPAQLEIIKRKLEGKRLKGYVYETGSRGYHIHIFFNHELTEKEKRYFIEYFGSDILKAGKSMIALEHCPHWKTGKEKRLVEVING